MHPNERDFVLLIPRQERIRLGKHIQWPCNVQRHYPIEHDNRYLHGLKSLSAATFDIIALLCPIESCSILLRPPV
jgi:hypothetical protein